MIILRIRTSLLYNGSSTVEIPNRTRGYGYSEQMDKSEERTRSSNLYSDTSLERARDNTAQLRSFQNEMAEEENEQEEGGEEENTQYAMITIFPDLLPVVSRASTEHVVRAKNH